MPRATKFLTTLDPASEADMENLAEGALVVNVKSGPMRTRALNMLTDCRMLANQAITFPGQ